MPSVHGEEHRVYRTQFFIFLFGTHAKLYPSIPALSLSYFKTWAWASAGLTWGAATATAKTANKTTNYLKKLIPQSWIIKTKSLDTLNHTLTDFILDRGELITILISCYKGQSDLDDCFLTGTHVSFYTRTTNAIEQLTFTPLPIMSTEYFGTGKSSKCKKYASTTGCIFGAGSRK